MALALSYDQAFVSLLNLSDRSRTVDFIAVSVVTYRLQDENSDVRRLVLIGKSFLFQTTKDIFSLLHLRQ